MIAIGRQGDCKNEYPRQQGDYRFCVCNGGATQRNCDALRSNRTFKFADEATDGPPEPKSRQADGVV